MDYHLVKSSLIVALVRMSDAHTDPTASYDEKLKALLTKNTNLPQDSQSLGIWILWIIWKHRNVLLFQKRHTPWRTSLNLARLDNNEWKAAQKYIDRSHITTTRTHRRERTNMW